MPRARRGAAVCANSEMNVLPHADRRGDDLCLAMHAGRDLVAVPGHEDGSGKEDRGAQTSLLWIVLTKSGYVHRKLDNTSAG